MSPSKNFTNEKFGSNSSVFKKCSKSERVEKRRSLFFGDIVYLGGKNLLIVGLSSFWILFLRTHNTKYTQRNTQIKPHTTAFLLKKIVNPKIYAKKTDASRNIL